VSGTFATWAPAYWDRGYSVIPTEIATKRPANGLKGWTGLVNGPPGAELRQSLLSRFGSKGIGLLLGTEIAAGEVIGAVDVDDDLLVLLVAALLKSPSCGKRGKKGITYFVRVPREPKLKATQLRDADRKGKIDILLAGRQTVLPPTPHPETELPYQWQGKSLLESSFEELPVFTERQLQLLRVIVASPQTPTLISGETTHDAGVALTAQLISHGATDEETADLVTALLPLGYSGNSIKELPEWIRSAREKGFDTNKKRDGYDPGDVGPLQLGRSGDDFYFRCQQTKELVTRSAKQLHTLPDLLSLAPLSFWGETFPRFNSKGIITGVDVGAACDALIQACTRAGNINVNRIRGFGVWEEDGRLIANTGEEIIESDRYIYSYPPGRVNLSSGLVPMDAVMEMLCLPNWAKPRSGELVAGWAFVSVISGALPWRPHVAITGAAASGKSTALRAVGHLLSPVAEVFEGISTEAGIRQNLGYDARPAIIDELDAENTGDIYRIFRIVKLIRSSSSATGAVARGTPDGTPHNFSTRASFLIGAINMRRIGAADSTRIVRLEMRPPQNPRETRPRVIDLLDRLKGVGPAFCRRAIDLAPDTIASIPILHRAMPAIQERHADNMATLMAGYWVALNGRTIAPVEAQTLVDDFLPAIEGHQEDASEDDTLSCLNWLLAFQIRVDADLTLILGQALSESLYTEKPNSYVEEQLRNLGIKLEGKGFLVATSHRGLEQIFRGSRWEASLWASALERWPNARMVPQRRFGGGARSRAVWLPRDAISDLGPTAARAMADAEKNF
jgi:hypothetical protein